jgi:hypothetical protein
MRVFMIILCVRCVSLRLSYVCPASVYDYIMCVLRVFMIILCVLCVPCVCLWQTVQQEELYIAGRAQTTITVSRQILNDLFLAKKLSRD